VGKQTVPNCFVWASTYGITTFWAAQTRKSPPASATQLPSPDYTYIQVEVSTGTSPDTCTGGHITACLNWLKSNGGTPSLATAPDLGKSESESSCNANWSAYGPPKPALPPDPSLEVPGYVATDVTGSDGLNNLRAVIVSGVPLAYGTYLYTDFVPYNGTPSPYVGNGVWLYNKKTGKKAGHCMMIIGYDDTKGAVMIQNSFGASWGSDGFIWMAYDTFQAMAQGAAFYIPGPHAV
jgi:Papain family cysteine protease